jgi:formylglycine-generating enzyme required for sulfatase activity
VSWWEAMEFCHRLSQRKNRIYSLPSEAQWEYACRAGTATTFHCGATVIKEIVNFDANHISRGWRLSDQSRTEYRDQTSSAVQFPANGWGLYDMHGNVQEWCLDDWHESYQGAPDDGRAWLAGLASNSCEDNVWSPKVLRGGSWSLGPWGCRSAFRTRWHPSELSSGIGLRVICLPQCSSLNA